MPSLFHGHSDHWWGGQDWDFWWARLPPAERRQLLALGWGEEPFGLGVTLTSLHGATHAVDAHVGPDERHPMRSRASYQRHLLTDDFRVWLEEKRAAGDDRIEA